jgi:adenylate cyclase
VRFIDRMENPGDERAYVVSERRSRIPASRALILIAIVTFISYLMLNPMHFPREGVIEYSVAAGIFILVLGCFFALTFSRFYLEQGWVDFVLFSALTVAMVLLIDALGKQADITGISRFGMAVINLGILVVFASVGFVATTRLFFTWAAILFVAYLVFLLLADRTFVSKIYTFSNFSTFFVFALFVNWDIDRRARIGFSANLALDAERRKTEELLYNVLPQEAAQRLRAGETVADSFSDVSVIFVDIVGFSKLAKLLSPGHLVKLLNDFFLTADECAQEHGVEKVKTIGDAYLAVSGASTSAGRSAASAVDFARALIERAEKMAQETGIDLKVRVGIHTGPVVGGVVGSRRLSYDYWGDTMNIAARLESIAEHNGVAVSASTYFQLAGREEFEPAETLVLKGIGETEIYRLKL